MKITVYTINDCQYSKAEKDYLQAHNLPFEEKNLETNKQYLTEMLALANNFAGTPVTKIEKDDGQISILKGFTKEEFDKLTGVGQPQTAVVNSTVNVPTSPAVSSSKASATEEASAQAGQPSITPPPTPVAPPPAPMTPPVTPQPPPPPPVDDKKDEALNSVLNDLQTKAETPAVTPPSPTNLPNIPEPDFK